MRLHTMIMQMTSPRRLELLEAEKWPITSHKMSIIKAIARTDVNRIRLSSRLGIYSSECHSRRPCPIHNSRRRRGLQLPGAMASDARHPRSRSRASHIERHHEPMVFPRMHKTRCSAKCIVEWQTNMNTYGNGLPEPRLNTLFH